MKLFNKPLNFSDPKLPSIEEFRRMSQEEYTRDAGRYWDELCSRNQLERAVIQLRWTLKYLLLEFPGEVLTRLEVLLGR